MTLPECHMCGCDMFEQAGGCVCRCHFALNRLLELNHGDREATRQELEREFNNPTPMPDKPFRIPGVGMGIPVNDPAKIEEVLKILGVKPNKDMTVKVGSTFGRGDPKKMSGNDLIDYQVYTGIQVGKLPQGFVLDKRSRVELANVLDQIKEDERIAMAIGFLAGYNNGFKFGKSYKYD